MEINNKTGNSRFEPLGGGGNTCGANHARSTQACSLARLRNSNPAQGTLQTLVCKPPSSPPPPPPPACRPSSRLLPAYQSARLPARWLTIIAIFIPAIIIIINSIPPCCSPLAARLEPNTYTAAPSLLLARQPPLQRSSPPKLALVRRGRRQQVRSPCLCLDTLDLGLELILVVVVAFCC